MTEKITFDTAAGQSQMLAEMAKMRMEASATTLPPMAGAVASSGPSFGSVLNEAINHVDDLQHVASAQQRAVDMGESDDLATAMLESQKASVAFSALMQVRNKLSSAFDEVMNISL